MGEVAAPIKTCRVCGTDKPVTDYYRRSASHDGHRSECAECTRQAARQRTNRDTERDRRYRARYGITAVDVDQLRVHQDYRCALCARHEDRLPLGLVVDHCHLSDTVRGLLCNACNAGLGYFADNPDRLRAAVAYLARADELATIAHDEEN